MLFRRGQSELGAAFVFLQYYFILITVFGYYSLWSKHILGVFAQLNGSEYVAQLVSALGTPFFIIALLMLMMWVCRITGRRALVMLPSVSVGVGVIVTTSNILGYPALSDIDGIWTLAGIVTTLVCAVLLLGEKTPLLAPGKKPFLLGILLALVVAYLTRLSMLAQLPSYDTIFNILYFALHTALVLLYIVFAPSIAQSPKDSFADLAIQYGISKRELDIVEGIYAGKTNQEIANALFITLQTVKDHTSRIYQKTFVKNRGQLVALLRGG